MGKRIVRQDCSTVTVTPHLRKPLLVDVIHHYNLMVITRRRSSRAKTQMTQAWVTLWIHTCKYWQRAESLPETAWTGSHGRRSAAFVPGDALGAEVLGEEVQFVRRGLEGQLVQLLLWWTGWLEMKQIYIQHENKRKKKEMVIYFYVDKNKMTRLSFCGQGRDDKITFSLA